MCALGVHSAAQPLPKVEVRGVTKDPPTPLSPSQALHVRVAYVYSQPLRFQAADYSDGQKRDQMMTNIAPVYPTGQGEAAGWPEMRVRRKGISIHGCSRGR